MTNKNPGVRPLFWWIGWIALTIGSFFAASSFWTSFISRHFGSVRNSSNSILWVALVFGTWMVILVPLIILMYNKVDKVYEEARIRRESARRRLLEEQAKKNIRSIRVDESKRILSRALAKRLKRFPEAVRGGHLVHATLADGRKIEPLFIVYRREVVGIYGAQGMDFEAKDIVDLAPVALETLPSDFREEGWLRLDGI